MRVLIVSEVYRPGLGGVQQAIDTLVDGLCNAGDEVVVMTGSPQFKITPYSETIENGAKILRLPAVAAPINRKNNRMTVFPGWYVRRFLAAQPRFDIIHFHTPGTWLHLGILNYAEKHAIPTIVTNHSIALNLTMNQSDSLTRAFMKWHDGQTTKFINRCDLMTAPTKSALKATHGITTKQKAVSNGVDTRFFVRTKQPSKQIYKKYQLDPAKTTITYTGRLDGEKRVDLLIEAFKKLASKRSDVQLVIVGRGLLDTVVREHARQAGGRVHFTGFIKDNAEKRDVLLISDCFVMPSPAELQCISALEALACEVPLVVADQLALPELIDGGKNGVMFHYPDATDLAAKIEKILADPARRRHMAKAGRAWAVKHHDHEKTVAAYRQLYAGFCHPSRTRKSAS